MQKLFLLITVACSLTLCGTDSSQGHGAAAAATSNQTLVAWEPGHLKPNPWMTPGQGSAVTLPSLIPAGTADYGRGMAYRRAGGDINNREAAKCFLSAAKLGHAAAMFELGYMYERGDGVSQEYRKAAALYKHAADRGHADSIEKLKDPMIQQLLTWKDTAELDPLR